MSKIENFIKEIKEMKVTELNELVKAIETEFGVTAAAPMAAAAAGGAAAESSTKSVHLLDAGANKVSTIKVVRDVLGLGLMEAKAFVDKAPAVVKEGLAADKAAELVKLFTDAGAKAEAK